MTLPSPASTSLSSSSSSSGGCIVCKAEKSASERGRERERGRDQTRGGERDGFFMYSGGAVAEEEEGEEGERRYPTE